MITFPSWLGGSLFKRRYGSLFERRRQIVVLPHALQFLAGFLMVAAPIFTSFRLGSILVRGYEDTSNPRGMRVAGAGPSRKSTRKVWMIVGLMVLFFFIFVMALA